jgi:hypothetical protein
VDSDGSLTKGLDNRVKPATSRTYGWVSDDTVLPPESPRRPTQERSGAMAPSVGSKQLLESLLVALVPSSLGLVAYAILREAYVWFYQRYGVAPEEVGLTQLRVLSSMFRFIHLWVWSIPGSPGTNILIVLLISAGMVSLWRRLLPRLRRRSRYINLMADRHPILLGTSMLVLLIIFSFAWALPLDRSFAGKRLQLGRMVHPAELAFLSIEADPARVSWIGPGRPPKELLSAKLVYLGKADGILVLYQPPDWGSCEVDSCRGATWKVQESDVVLRLEANPPDRDAPKQQAVKQQQVTKGSAYLEGHSMVWH